MKFTKWVLAKIDEHRSGEGPRRTQDPQALVQGHQASRQELPLSRGWLTRLDKGIHIGTGGYSQGSLWIKAAPEQGPLEAPVIDYDDDDEVIARFPNLGTLLDTLMER